MKNALVIITGIVFACFVGWIMLSKDEVKQTDQPIASKSMEGLPLQKYSIPRLQQTTFTPSPITIGDTINLNVTPTVRQFFFSDSFAPDKKISGTMMFPPTPGTYPVIILYRGWADEEIYTPGYGTKNAATYFAQNGYITVSPDFLGYADSDPYAESAIEARFQGYTTAITLLKSLENFNPALSSQNINYTLDTDRVGIWGHSNGGQITLSVLAVTGQNIPTTLWAPVTIPFPDNILHYSQDQDDGGALIQRLVSDFTTEYDADTFTPTSYLDLIDAPILLHQVSADDAVPKQWNDDFATIMDKLGKGVTYYEYPGADHNMRPVWGTVIRRDLEHFDQYLK